MPHVVLAGRVDLERLLEKLEKTTYRDPITGVIIRTEGFYRSKEGDTILAKAVVVEEHPQSFYIMLAGKGDELVIRLDPTTDPEKTPGVKRALALLSEQVIATEGKAGLKVSRTNISEFSWKESA